MWSHIVLYTVIGSISEAGWGGVACLSEADCNLHAVAERGRLHARCLSAAVLSVEAAVGAIRRFHPQAVDKWCGLSP